MLKDKLHRAEAGYRKTQISLEAMSQKIEQGLRDKWTAMEAKALEEGGEALSIYEVAVDKG